VSTIKVDTIQTRGGVSEIAIDKLKGASSASSISVVAEGGSTTTNLQQGLAKAWVNFNGTGTIATRDSFNVASLTDNATGDYVVNISNAFGAADYSVATNTQDLSGASNSQVLSLTASTTPLYTITISPLVLADNPTVSVNCYGDLA